MTWSYRVVRYDDPYGALYAIHEVRYRDGQIDAVEGQMVASGESWQELRSELDRMLEAFAKPVLDESLKEVVS